MRNLLRMELDIKTQFLLNHRPLGINDKDLYIDGQLVKDS